MEISGRMNGIEVQDFPPHLDPAELEAKAAAPSFVTARQLIAEHLRMREPIIDGICRRGEIVNVIAPPKSNKSWLVLAMALSVATGRDWLGYPTTQGKVLIIDNELHPETLAHRIPMVAKALTKAELAALKALGIEPDEYQDNLCIKTVRGELEDIYRMATFFDSIEPGQFKLIVLDAFYRTLPPGISENDNAEIAQIYNQLDRYAQRLDCAFVLIHHASKGNQSAKAVTDVGAGAGSQSRAADAHLILRPHEEEGLTVLDAVVRSFPPPPAVSLKFDFPLWHVQSDIEPRLALAKTAADAKQANKDKAGIEELVKAMAAIGEPVARRKCRELIGSGPDRTNRLIKLAIDQGKIEPAGTAQVKGKTAELFAVSKSETDHENEGSDTDFC